MNQLHTKLHLPKPKPISYNLQMVGQTIIKPIGLMKDLNIFMCMIYVMYHIHSIIKQCDKL
jgi:hypothetical protein